MVLATLAARVIPTPTAIPGVGVGVEVWDAAVEGRSAQAIPLVKTLWFAQM